MKLIYEDGGDNQAYELNNGNYFIDLNGNQFILTKETYKKIAEDSAKGIIEKIKELDISFIRTLRENLGLASIILEIKNPREVLLSNQ